MPGKQARDEVQQSGKYHYPSGLKVEIAAPAVLVRQHVRVAGRHQLPRGRHRKFEQRSGQIVASFAPIEAWVRDDNFTSADEQGKKTQGGDPVSNADEGRVPRSSRGGGDSRSRNRNASGIAHRGIVSCAAHIANAGLNARTSVSTDKR